MKISNLIVATLLLFGVLSCKNPQDFIFPEDGLLNNADESLSALKAVGKYQGISSCTAVYVQVSSKLDAPAYVLTNGHCVQDWTPNAVFLNMPAKTHEVVFNRFKDTPENEQVKVGVKQIAYSTMKGTDLAIVELNATVRQLEEKGIKPLKIAESLPQTGEKIKVFGIPVTGVEFADQYLRQSSCVQGTKTDLIEFTWTWWDMYRNDCANIKGGSSGSPVLSSIKEGVFGLINTTTIGAETPCYLGGPCESSNNQVGMQANASYTLSVVGVGACFNSNGIFDVNLAGCTLDKGNNVKISGSPMGEVNPSAQEINGPKPQQNWDYTVSGMKYYRYKIGKMGESSPRDPNGYSSVFTTSTSPDINSLLPTAPGHYYLAVVGGDTPGYDATWQQVSAPTVVRIEIDVTPPTKEPIIIVNEIEDGFSVALGFSPPELSNYVFKAGDPATTDENDKKGYYTYRRIPFEVYSDELPIKICVIGYDNAGNATKPLVKILK